MINGLLLYIMHTNEMILSIIWFGLLLGLSLERWTEEQAAKWYSKYNWSAGVNYIPAYAVNEI